MPPNTALKRATPKKKKNRVNGSATGAESAKALDLSRRMERLDIINVPIFSMDFKLPFILFIYNEGIDQRVQVHVLVPTLPKEFFIPDIVGNGRRLLCHIQVPSFFVDQTRAMEANAGEAGFNKNRHQAQKSFKDVCEQIDEQYGPSNKIFGKPMHIDLPFVCEETIVEWEIQAYPNDLGTLAEDLGGQQFFACLAVTLRKLHPLRKLPTKRKKTTGGFRVIGGMVG